MSRNTSRGEILIDTKKCFFKKSKSLDTEFFFVFFFFVKFECVLFQTRVSSCIPSIKASSKSREQTECIKLRFLWKDVASIQNHFFIVRQNGDLFKLGQADDLARAPSWFLPAKKNTEVKHTDAMGILNVVTWTFFPLLFLMAMGWKWGGRWGFFFLCFLKVNTISVIYGHEKNLCEWAC